MLGHHYQRDEVIEFADVTGDSFKLAREAAARPDSPYIVFCGVHFMAESADILTSDAQQVVLPDLAAGCSMADMAAIGQVEACWRELEAAGVAGSTVPVTYMNSSAAIKAFTGRHGGTVCTSSNAKASLEGPSRRATGCCSCLISTSAAILRYSTSVCRWTTVVYNPTSPRRLGRRATPRQDDPVAGHCSVHGRFTLESVAEVRERIPGVNVLVHPECRHEVVRAADHVGSTEHIITTLAAAEPGSAWAIGTELNLVRRLADAHPDKQIVFLDRTVCYCSTMNRIDLPHLVWALENLVAGRVVNQITVPAEDAHFARVALDQMLALPGVGKPKD